MHKKNMKIAVIGSGISGLSCAWLLSQNHQVTVFEQDQRIGGHSNTQDAVTSRGTVAVDTGFIVFNPPNYPNLVALFEHLGVAVTPTDMSFGVSLNKGAVEYSGSGLGGLFAQTKNLVSLRFWGMLRDILRFYKTTNNADFALDPKLSLGDFIRQGGYGEAFCYEHLLPMGAAIWSTPMEKMLDYPAQSFIDFCANHGLLQLADRPQWHTVIGGSRAYVSRLRAAIKGDVYSARAIVEVKRVGVEVHLVDAEGELMVFDQVVFACHADQALRLLVAPTLAELAVLKPFRFAPNRAVLHSDPLLMPQRKKVWSSWNYLGETQVTSQSPRLSVSYWMNQLQQLTTDTPMIVTLNPFIEPRAHLVHASFDYEHPVFDQATAQAQRALWDIQGQQNTWFCGAWCGYGFHEDGLQSGLVVAEALGGSARPWAVAKMNARLPLPANWHERQFAQQVL
jgi:uncharacterized protein